MTHRTSSVSSQDQCLQNSHSGRLHSWQLAFQRELFGLDLNTPMLEKALWSCSHLVRLPNDANIPSRGPISLNESTTFLMSQTRGCRSSWQSDRKTWVKACGMLVDQTRLLLNINKSSNKSIAIIDQYFA